MYSSDTQTASGSWFFSKDTKSSYVFYILLFLFLFFPALWRYSWHTMLYKFKVYNLMIWFTYILWNDYTVRLVNTSVTAELRFFVCVVLRTFKICPLSNFPLYNTVLLIVVTIFYVRFLELTQLMTGSLYPFSTFTHFSLLFYTFNNYLLLIKRKSLGKMWSWYCWKHTVQGIFHYRQWYNTSLIFG